MKTIIGEQEYTRLRNLRFSVETDITAASMPINSFSVDIATDESIQVTGRAELRDDLGQLWAMYSIKTVVEQRDGWTHLEAVSPLHNLDRRKTPAVMYSGATTGTELGRLLTAGLDGVPFEFADQELEERTFSGYCPEQTYRERLLQICMATGLHVRDYNTDKIILEDWPAEETLVPTEDTYRQPHPQVDKREDSTLGVKCTAYSFRAGTPQPGDKSVEAAGVTYIVTGQEVTLTKVPVVPEDASMEDVSSCMLIDTGNADAVLERLAQYYFYPTKVGFSCLNNHSYWAGDKLTVPTGDDELATGFAQRMDYRFGLQAMSQVELVGCQDADTAKLTVKYVWDGINLGKKVYHLPIGYTYTIQNPCLDKKMNQHRYIFRPLTSEVSGTLTQKTTVTVEYAVALDLHKKVLKVLIVDEVHVEERQDSDGNTVRVAVIG